MPDQSSSTTTTEAPQTPPSSRPPRRSGGVRPPAFTAAATPDPDLSVSAPAYGSELGSEPAGPAMPPPLDEPLSGPPGSSPASGPDLPVASRRALERSIREGLKGAGHFANLSLTATDDEQLYGVYLLDEDDQKDLAAPLASLAARHATPGVLNPDLADALAALVALAVYASKQLGKLRELRRQRTAGPAPYVDVDHTPPGESAAA